MIKHNLSRSKIYKLHDNIIKRCYHINDKDYYMYGALGINVCDDWNTKIVGKSLAIQNFFEWSIKNGYKDGLSIDRIDNSIGYYPCNCRWTNRFIQANNTRRNKFLTKDNHTKSISQWSRDESCKVNIQTFYTRLKKGISLEEALKPVKRYQFNGDLKSLSQIYKTSSSKVSMETFFIRVKNGWSIGDALSTPSLQGKRNVYK